MVPAHIVVLGGGITGLSSAFYLSRRFPDSLITVFEQQLRLGGWISSERVAVRDVDGREANVVLEAGPRTLRPNSKALLELIHLLDLSPSLLLTPRTSAAAKNRFLHIPGTRESGLTPLPSSLFSLFTSPLGPLLLSAILCEPFWSANRFITSSAQDAEYDESFDALLTRRFGERLARTLGSALVHGVYAADSRMLSVRAAFPSLLDAERRGKGSIVRGFLTRAKTTPEEEKYDLGDVSKRMKGVSVYSFEDGLSTLVSALEAALVKLPNVKLRTGVEIKSLHIGSEDKQIIIDTSEGPITDATHVVSAIPLARLSAIVPTNSLPHLTANPSSSVSVLNLIFPPSAGPPLHPPGFGYLIPRPTSGYACKPVGDTSGLSDDTNGNPGILGVVFDSCTLSAQDTGSPGFTKLTVMLGGPYPHPITDTPSILAHLQSHLSLPSPLPEPVFSRIHHHRQCIPVPTPGHVGRMEELREVLRDEKGVWKGRLEVIGAGVGGVSVGDCVEAGRKVGTTWE